MTGVVKIRLSLVIRFALTKPFPRDFVYPRTPHGEGGYPFGSRWERKKFFLLELGMSVAAGEQLLYAKLSVFRREAIQNTSTFSRVPGRRYCRLSRNRKMNEAGSSG